VSLQLTSQVAHVGNIVKVVLSDLIAQNPTLGPDGVPITIYGPADDGADSSPPSISWMPTSEQFAEPQRLGAAGAPGSLRMRVVPVSFVICGGVEAPGTYGPDETVFHDCDLTEILMSKLANSMHRLLSQFPYSLESATWFNGGKTGIGMSCELIVAFKLPLIREDNPTVTVTAVKANAEITKP
jgi:hypothetical protein